MLIGEWMRINPCPLCIFQRILYLAVGLWALFGVVVPQARRLWGGLIAATAAGGMATAIYQTWMQMYRRGGNAVRLRRAEPDRATGRLAGHEVAAMFMATGFCTSKEYILGLTMANWSIARFFIFLVLGLWIGFAPLREKNASTSAERGAGEAGAGVRLIRSGLAGAAEAAVRAR